MLDTNNISEDLVNQYIAWADNDINAKLSVLYSTPIPPYANYEAALLGDIDPDHNPYIVLDRPGLFSVWDTIFLTDGTNEEWHVVDSVTNGTIIQTVTAITHDFGADDTRVIRYAYPYPITQCSARYAAANIYDKYFASQTDPNTSEYGRFLKQQVRQDLNNILNGRTVLHGARRIARRFYNPNLDDEYGLRGTIAPGGKDMDEIR